MIKKFKCLLVMFFVTFGGSFLSFKLLSLSSDNKFMEEVSFRDVFTGHKAKYKKWFTQAEKANADTRANHGNQALDEIFPWMLIAFVSFFSLSLYPVFKIWSNALWV